ncbi:MAG: class I SAM-dependent methyltransferase [Candidatus Methylomirabilis oxyfera]|nr:class I SAM-dependent methyltransferase [Candidatus Methylomirabilis oxyfera]
MGEGVSEATRGALGEFWRAVLGYPGPRVVFGGDALVGYPGQAGRPGPTLVVDSRPVHLAAVFSRVPAIQSDLDAGSLRLASPRTECDLIEEVKSLVAYDQGASPHVALAPGLPPEQARTYREWGEAVRRFVELSRDLTVLNLEMYARFKLVADRIAAVGDDPFRILDVGGREWFFSAFLPRHRVTVADLDTTGLDGRALPFPPRSFDIVTCHHVLEHVPASDRPALLAELVRVARRRVYLTGPFCESRFAAEIDRFLSHLAPDNPYLREHLQMGLPSLVEVEAWLRARGLSHTVEPITRCNTWLLALVLSAMQPVRPDACREVNRYYNSRFQELDRGEPAYQSLVEIRVN